MATTRRTRPSIELTRFSGFFRNVHGKPEIEAALAEAARAGKLRVTVNASTRRELKALAAKHPELEPWIIDLTGPGGTGDLDN
ncbi:hypothetical protein [Pinisolibacter aquiterrae]|uniref:hypothetical protein n=1 Tax=Pinisolibacter aquiterrae TaxID=2815579 RepID=UPI001C3D5E76|nr:hypothetical protein [Pinisolibacter aquiterrae]MBV5265176.1 hypothetical protein [Pinisolibacter aquiterrae]MCC8235494.1 hypothetical protein [Pinisolibacter aquiterrae]